MQAWRRTDLGTKTYRGSTKHGPNWNTVIARVTTVAGTENIVAAELTQRISKEDVHRILPKEEAAKDGKMDIDTFLVYKTASKTKHNDHDRTYTSIRDQCT